MNPVEEVLKANGFGKLNPAQQAAVDGGLLLDKSMVVCAPTAAGKTVIAEIAMLDMLAKGRKVVYIVPLKALASEKYREFKEKYEPKGIRVAISVGDLDSGEGWLSSYDVIIATSEKLDSLMRHGAQWITQVGLVIADEIHMLDDADRGPTLEIVLTKLRKMSKPKILGLSATISNYIELAEWLEGGHVKSDYRPVRLEKGVCFGKKIRFEEGEVDLSGENEVFELVGHANTKGKQALVFCNTRRGAEAAAEKLAGYFSLGSNELEAISNGVLGALDTPTRQCRRLAHCVKGGFAFHHSGLSLKQRTLIEDSFRAGKIKAICCTPTLAAGLNLPAWRVVVRDLKRFHSIKGMDYISNLEVMQMCGRAGRPQYDTEGQAVLCAKTEIEEKYAWERYINGELEGISSKLGVGPILKMHILSLVAEGFCTSTEGLLEFFSKTFYAHKYGDMERLGNRIRQDVKQLAEYGFVEMEGSKIENPFVSALVLYQQDGQEIKATRLGKRVSELYINPDSAHGFIGRLEMACKSGFEPLDLLFVICESLEMGPHSGVRAKEAPEINELLIKQGERMLVKPPNEWDYEYEEYIKRLKTALVLKAWAEEATEDELLENNGVTPGELRARLDNADWMLYSLQEIALLCGYKELINPIRKLRLRVEYGIGEELLPLVKLKGVGRVRARKMFASGMKRLQDLREIPIESLERILGEKTARDVKAQVVGKIDDD